MADPACARCGEPCRKCEREETEEKSRERFGRFTAGWNALEEAARDPRALQEMLERDAEARAPPAPPET